MVGGLGLVGFCLYLLKTHREPRPCSVVLWKRWVRCRCEQKLGGTRLTIASTVMGDPTIGASVQCERRMPHGRCGTDHDFSVDVSPETLHVTRWVVSPPGHR